MTAAEAQALVDAAVRLQLAGPWVERQVDGKTIWERRIVWDGRCANEGLSPIVDPDDLALAEVCSDIDDESRFAGVSNEDEVCARVLRREDAMDLVDAALRERGWVLA